MFLVLPLLFPLCGEGPRRDYAVQIEGGIEDGLGCSGPNSNPSADNVFSRAHGVQSSV